VRDIFSSERARHRPFLNSKAVLANFDKTEKFSRKVWGLLSLELWHQLFHDSASSYRRLLDQQGAARVAAQ
jgi:asparagine synthase (glutamine-hydrolysing)